MFPQKNIILECLSDSILLYTAKAGSEALELAKSYPLSNDADSCHEMRWLDAFQEALNALKPSTLGVLDVILPEPFCLTKILHVPKVRASKQKAIIKVHIEQTLPHVAGRSFYRYAVLNANAIELTLWVVFVGRHWLQKICEIFVALPLKLRSIQLPAPLIYNAYRVLYPKDPQQTLLVSVSEAFAHLFFIERDLLFYRRITLEQKAFTLSAYKALTHEILLSLNHCQTLPKAIMPKRILVSATVPFKENFFQHLKFSFSLPVHCFNSECAHHPIFQNTPSLPVAGMLAKAPVKLNLIPSPFERTFKVVRHKTRITAIATLFSVSLLFLVPFLDRRMEAYHSQLQRLQSHVVPLEKNHKKICENIQATRHFQDVLSTIKQIGYTNEKWNHFLMHLQEALVETEDVWIDHLTLTPESEEEPNADCFVLELKGALLNRDPVLSANTSEPIDRIEQLFKKIGQSEFILEEKRSTSEFGTPLSRFIFSYAINSL